MPFLPQTVKGLNQYLLDPDLDPQALRLHISEIAPGAAMHPPHTHAGIEAFYVLEGHGTLTVGAESYLIGPNDALLLDPTKPHGLTNTGDTPMRYLVMMVQHG